MRTKCSIFSELLTWFSFGKEVASPTKIIRIDDFVFNFCRDRVDTGFFLLSIEFSYYSLAKNCFVDLVELLKFLKSYCKRDKRIVL